MLTVPTVSSSPSNTNPSTPSGTNGIINLGLTGGTGTAFTFAVYNNVTNALVTTSSSSNSGVFSNLAQGTYRIVVTDPGVDATCSGRTTTFFATLTDPITTFNGSSWSFGAPSGSVDGIIDAADAAPGAFTVRNLIINNGGSLKNGNSVITVNGSLTNNSDTSTSGTIYFNGGNTAQINGNKFYFGGVIRIGSGTSLQTNGLLQLIDGGALLHGSGTTGGGGSITGGFEHARNGSTNTLTYNYWSTPVASATLSVLGNRDLREFNASTQTWNPTGAVLSLPGTTAMTVGKGYTATAANTAVFSGTPNNGSISPSMVVNAGPNNDWNLMGNPYPSGINATTFLNDNVNNINGAVYFWNKPFMPTGNNMVGSDYIAKNLTSGSFIIPSHQGFFVEALSTSLNFNNGQRTGTNNTFYRTSNDILRATLALVNPLGDANTTLIGFTTQATDGYDRLYDAKKLQGNGWISFYSLLSAEAYAIQGMGELNVTKSVPVGMKVNRTGTYTISLSQLENFDANTLIYLEDTQTHMMHNLRAGAYNFTVATTGTIDNRFIIHFQPLSTSVKNIDDQHTVNVRGNVNRLVVTKRSDVNINGINLYDVAGKLIHQWNNFTSGENIQLDINVSEGIYLVKVSTDAGEQSVKINLTY
jgi:hypothetical protein